MSKLCEEKKYYLIPADFELYDFNNVKKETEKNEGLLWHSQTWSFNEESGWTTRNYNYEKGGIVYFYYKNVPDLSSRILLRGEIKDVDREGEWSFKEGKNRISKTCKSIAIENLKPVLLNDLNKYNYDSLINKYGLKSVYRQEIKEKKLIDDLEKDYDRKGDLSNIVNHFNKEAYCECCEILGRSQNEKSKRTFIKNNGIIYGEIHHLLMQNVTKKGDNWFEQNNLDKSIKNWVDENFNKVRLCPVCHREMHYGNFGSKDKKESVIKEIMKNHHYDENLKKYVKSSEKIDEIKKYIFEQYNI